MAVKLVKLVKLTGALLKSIQPGIDRWLFVKANYVTRQYCSMIIE